MLGLLYVFAVLSLTHAAPNYQIVHHGDINLTHSKNVGITGGYATDIIHHPWMVSVHYKYLQICGGILISPFWVLSAAHCLVQGYLSDISIRAGSTSSSKGGQTAEVYEYILHDDYNNNNLDNDIVLLHLKTAITHKDAFSADLDTPGQDYPDGLELVVAGWGYTSEHGGDSDTLLEVVMETISTQTCNDTKSITANMFCALSGINKGPCGGDDGGPATIDQQVVGIISYIGGVCSKPTIPVIFVKIANYRNWIKINSGV